MSIIPRQNLLNISSTNDTHIARNTKGRPAATRNSRALTTSPIQSVKPAMSLWQSYRNLSPRTRLFIGGGLVAYAAFGLTASDQIEQYLGWTATEEDRQRLPKVHMVDRREK